jgi:hypothetical protein
MVGRKLRAKVLQALKRGKSPLDVARLFRLSMFTIALIATAPDMDDSPDPTQDRVRSTTDH